MPISSASEFLVFWAHQRRLISRPTSFVFPSIEEGSALVTYEALAYGLLVVTTPNAGSVVRDGVEGFIVPICDPDAPVERTDRPRADAQLRHQMGIAARSGFTQERHRKAISAAYFSLHSSKVSIPDIHAGVSV
jgi:glycosyltransferase involved in cell wall biosynthesis